MASQGIERLEHLKDAFLTFNQVSEELMSSYHQLEAQVERLSAELARRDALTAGSGAALQLHNMLDALPGAVVVLNGRGRVVLANRAATVLLGEPLSDEQWRDVIQRAFEPRPDDGHDVSLKDGRRVSIATNSLDHEPGQVLLITDVTEKRQLQDRLGRFHRLSAMGQMAASLAHQIRTPAASALLYLSTLGRHAGDADAVAKYSSRVRDQLNHIEALVSDMLVYARGGSDEHAAVFTLATLTDAVQQAVQEQFEQSGATLEIKNSIPRQRLMGNCDALKGALINLLMNSLQGAGQTPLKVTLSAKAEDGERAVISVNDNGMGIADDVQARIFDPFFTTRPQGTGLGLAVVKAVVEKLGGGINLVSRQGEGTCVTLALPLYRDNNGKPSNPDKSELEVRL